MTFGNIVRDQSVDICMFTTNSYFYKKVFICHYTPLPEAKKCLYLKIQPIPLLN